VTATAQLLGIVVIVLAAVGVATALVSAYWISTPRLDRAVRARLPAPALRFGVDTLAFANENRTIYRGKPDLYPSWCFLMARAVLQFHRFARFDAGAAALTTEEYTERVRRITARRPWRAPLPPGERIVIPGYASLNEFSRAEERAVKAALRGRFWSWIHWTNWRVALPVLRAQQEGVARETIAELQAGRPVQWLLTNFPVIELNHTVVVYAYCAAAPDRVDFLVYDPNEPAVPGTIGFDVRARRFRSTRLYNTSVGPIRAFRMYFCPLL
jgi:hypothetical protein